MEIFKIDSTICDYYSDTKEDEEGANIIVGWCHDNGCECSEVPFDECLVKAIQYCKLKDKQLKRKEEECKWWKEEYTTAKSMYDLCQSDFMELAKIKSKYEQALKSVKNSLETIKKVDGNFFDEALTNEFDYMLQKISECEGNDGK